MSVVINGILNRKLPWGLVLLGVFLVVAVELLGIRSLSFAVGLLPVDRDHRRHLLRRHRALAGGARRSEAPRRRTRRARGRSTPAASSRRAASWACSPSCVKLLATQEKVLLGWIPTQLGQGRRGAGTRSSLVGILAFAALAFSLYYFARKPLETADPPAPPAPRTEA